MPCAVTVQYPTANGAEKFDLDYYLKTHMTIVSKGWGPQGLIGWKINKFSVTADDQQVPYNIEAVLHFDSVESFQKAKKSPAGAEIMADIPNFSNQKPLIMVGEIVGSSS